jgi:hypothetical protein
MRNYSIVRIGNAYIIQADQKGVLKIASKRRAARLVSDAAVLLVSHATRRAPEQASASQQLPTIPEDQS